MVGLKYSDLFFRTYYDSPRVALDELGKYQTRFILTAVCSTRETEKDVSPKKLGEVAKHVRRNDFRRNGIRRNDIFSYEFS